MSRHVVAVTIALCAASSLARADLSKEQCLDAHSRGQDAKEQNKLSLARKLFLTCAQPACPAVVQSDCARFADELTRLQPSLTFTARDGSGSDLPDTTVYVDDDLVATRLDGAPHDIDPGKHVVRFTNAGKDKTVTVVVGDGEKGRIVAVTFGSAQPAAAVGAKTDPAPAKPAVKTTHATGARVLVWTGAGLLAAGAAFGAAGYLALPSNCSLSTHQCAAPPGDPAFGKATSAVHLTDIGWGAGLAGLAALGGGLVWYLSSAHTPKEHLAVAPWLSPNGAGLALGGPL
ncbi:MAG TPA: hypothetical protein VMJ10_08555 [Kofleriaceae bacterium]|nr:hypothetical protein [Kofleriaceae bacterium]